MLVLNWFVSCLIMKLLSCLSYVLNFLVKAKYVACPWTNCDIIIMIVIEVKREQSGGDLHSMLNNMMNMVR